MDASFGIRLLWVAVPFVAMAWFFRSRANGQKKDQEFNPILAAAVCGGIMGGLLFLMFAMPFLFDSIWDVRRIWWSSFGPFPSLKVLMPLSMVLGLLFARLRGGVLEKARFAALAPLAAWLLISPPQNELVTMSRIREAGWRDGVCLQSTGFTCGPSAAATILRVYGIESSEAEMATRCNTTDRGSTLLGIARGLASKLPEGKFTVRVCRLTADEISKIHTPCLTCTYRHAWVVFGVNADGTLDMGEGVNGRQFVTWNTFSSSFTGDAIVITPEAQGEYSGEVHDSALVASRIGYVKEVDGSGRTLLRFGSAPIEKLMAESDGW